MQQRHQISLEILEVILGEELGFLYDELDCVREHLLLVRIVRADDLAEVPLSAASQCLEVIPILLVQMLHEETLKRSYKPRLGLLFSLDDVKLLFFALAPSWLVLPGFLL